MKFCQQSWSNLGLVISGEVAPGVSWSVKPLGHTCAESGWNIRVTSWSQVHWLFLPATLALPMPLKIFHEEINFLGCCSKLTTGNVS